MINEFSILLNSGSSIPKPSTVDYFTVRENKKTGTFPGGAALISSDMPYTSSQSVIKSIPYLAYPGSVTNSGLSPRVNFKSITYCPNIGYVACGWSDVSGIWCNSLIVSSDIGVTWKNIEVPLSDYYSSTYGYYLPYKLTSVASSGTNVVVCGYAETGSSASTRTIYGCTTDGVNWNWVKYTGAYGIPKKITYDSTNNLYVFSRDNTLYNIISASSSNLFTLLRDSFVYIPFNDTRTGSSGYASNFGSYAKLDGGWDTVTNTFFQTGYGIDSTVYNGSTINYRVYPSIDYRNNRTVITRSPFGDISSSFNTSSIFTDSTNGYVLVGGRFYSSSSSGYAYGIYLRNNLGWYSFNGGYTPITYDPDASGRTITSFCKVGTSGYVATATKGGIFSVSLSTMNSYSAGNWYESYYNSAYDFTSVASDGTNWIAVGNNGIILKNGTNIGWSFPVNSPTYPASNFYPGEVVSIAHDGDSFILNEESSSYELVSSLGRTYNVKYWTNDYRYTQSSSTGNNLKYNSYKTHYNWGNYGRFIGLLKSTAGWITSGVSPTLYTSTITTDTRDIQDFIYSNNTTAYCLWQQIHDNTVPTSTYRVNLDTYTNTKLNHPNISYTITLTAVAGNQAAGIAMVGSGGNFFYSTQNGDAGTFVKLFNYVPSKGNVNLNSVDYGWSTSLGRNVFYFCGENGTLGYLDPSTLYETVSVTTISTGVTSTINSVKYFSDGTNFVWIAIGNNGYYAYSTNGVNWTKVDVGTTRNFKRMGGYTALPVSSAASISYPTTARNGTKFSYTITGGIPNSSFTITATGGTISGTVNFGAFSFDGSGQFFRNDGDFITYTGVITVIFTFASSNYSITRTITVSN